MAGIEELAARWERTMGWCEPGARQARNRDDRAEEAVWERLAANYAATHNIYTQVPALGRRVQELLADCASVTEIGPGSGNFTLPLLASGKRVVGVEPSAAMRRAIRRRVPPAAALTVVPCKWEMYDGERTDAVFAVNSLYRIRDIVAALRRMQATARRRVLLVRTRHSSALAAYFTEAGAGLPEREDYLLLEEIPAALGYAPQVERLYGTWRLPVSRERIAREWREWTTAAPTAEETAAMWERCRRDLTADGQLVITREYRIYTWETEGK